MPQTVNMQDARPHNYYTVVLNNGRFMLLVLFIGCGGFSLKQSYAFKILFGVELYEQFKC